MEARLEGVPKRQPQPPSVNPLSVFVAAAQVRVNEFRADLALYDPHVAMGLPDTRIEPVDAPGLLFKVGS